MYFTNKSNMTITIYVRDNHLERLYKFIGGDEYKTIEYHQERPGLGLYYMVTIDYNDFIKFVIFSFRLCRIRFWLVQQ